MTQIALLAKFSREADARLMTQANRINDLLSSLDALNLTPSQYNEFRLIANEVAATAGGLSFIAEKLDALDEQPKKRTRYFRRK